MASHFVLKTEDLFKQPRYIEWHDDKSVTISTGDGTEITLTAVQAKDTFEYLRDCYTQSDGS